MSKIIFLKGLPASGKSTWAREFVSKNRNWIRLNKDDLRNMLHDGVYTKENENRVFNFRNQLLHAAMMDGLNIIIDDTNFNPYHEKLVKEVAQEYKAEFEVKFFDVPLEECLRRNSQRVGKAKVPDEVIVDMYNKYLKKEVLDKPYNDRSRSHCVVCDLDGTLALMNGGRGPFEWDKVYQDEINLPVWECLNAMRRAGFVIIFVSGREDSCREETQRWLRDKCGFVEEYPLFMRKSKDNRKDSIVKEEIYRKHIFPFYYIQFVLDDRNQVVDHLRELGLTVFQVAPGNF